VLVRGEEEGEEGGGKGRQEARKRKERREEAVLVDIRHGLQFSVVSCATRNSETKSQTPGCSFMEGCGSRPWGVFCMGGGGRSCST
jgi:hypothetical protein